VYGAGGAGKGRAQHLEFGGAFVVLGSEFSLHVQLGRSRRLSIGVYGLGFRVWGLGFKGKIVHPV
jgi:hypothetical protein